MMVMQAQKMSITALRLALSLGRRAVRRWQWAARKGAPSLALWELSVIIVGHCYVGPG